MAESTTLTALIAKLETSGSSDQLSLDEVLSVIGERGFGPLMMIIALLASLPTGAVPGVPTICGLSIALIAAQLVFGKHYPWLPQRLRRLSINRDRYKQVAERVIPWTRRLDRLVKPRWTHLTEGRAVRVVGLGILLLALCMPPLEFLPFAVVVPGSAIAIIGLGLTGRDGLWVVLGLIPAVIGIWLAAGLSIEVF